MASSGRELKKKQLTDNTLLPYEFKNHLMVFMETNAIDSEIHMKHKNTL